MNIDFRKEFEELKKEYGIKVLHLKNSKYIKCKCYNELHKSGNPKCNLCFGTGRLTTLEAKDTITYNGQGTNVDSELGNMIKDTNVFVFDYKSDLASKDLVLVVGFLNNKIADLKDLYEVTYTNPIRGDNGRIEYVIVNTKSSNHLKKQFTSLIKSLQKCDLNSLCKSKKVLTGDLNGI